MGSTTHSRMLESSSSSGSLIVAAPRPGPAPAHPGPPQAPLPLPGPALPPLPEERHRGQWREARARVPEGGGCGAPSVRGPRRRSRHPPPHRPARPPWRRLPGPVCCGAASVSHVRVVVCYYEHKTGFRASLPAGNAGLVSGASRPLLTEGTDRAKLKAVKLLYIPHCPVNGQAR